MAHQIQPYTDPALATIACHISDYLNDQQPGMVARWVASELPSYNLQEYPLVQVQTLTAEGQWLQTCKGSIRYILLNQDMQFGEHQETGLPYVRHAIAAALRQFRVMNDGCCCTISLHHLDQIKAQTMTGTIRGLDGTTVHATWVEVFFDYSDGCTV